MSFIQNFFTSRDNNANAESYVGQQGRLWFDPVTNQIYSSDGSTPGGIPLAGGGGGNGSPGGSNSQVQFNNSGTFGGSANLTFNRVSGALTAVSFVGDGSAIINITGANITGSVANATYADYASSAATTITAETVTANAQPNITSVGVLTGLSVNGNVTGNYFIGNGSQLTGISGGLPLANGTSNFDIATANGAATITANGTRTWTFDTAGALSLAGNVVTTANLTIKADNNNAWISQAAGDNGFSQLYWTSDIANADPYDGNSDWAWAYVDSGGFTVATNVVEPTKNYNWQFNTDGVLESPGKFVTTPGNTSAVFDFHAPGVSDGGSDLEFGASAPGSQYFVASVNDPSGQAMTFELTAVDEGNIEAQIRAQRGPDTFTWTFNGNGNLIFPGNTVYIGSDINQISIYSDINAETAGMTVITNSATSIFNEAVVNITTNAGDVPHQWQFDQTGNLTLPGSITRSGYNNPELLIANTDPNWAYGFSSDNVANYYTQVKFFGDNSSTRGFRISDVDSGNVWLFDGQGIATLPGEGVIQSINDTVTLRSLNTTTGNANSVYLGTSGGFGFSDQAIGGNWLEIFRNGDEPEIRVPVGRGNLNLQTAEGENSYNWTFGDNGTTTFPGNIINAGANPITLWSTDSSTLLWRSPTGGGPSVPVQTTVSAENGNATISVATGTLSIQSIKTWTFDSDGNTTFPDATVQTTAYPGTATAFSVTGNITGGNVIGNTSISVGGTGGDLTMTGGAITGVGNITANGIVAINAPGGITTTQTSFDIVNATATTVNIGGSATAVNIGAVTGTLTINNPTLLTGGIVSAAGNVTSAANVIASTAFITGSSTALGGSATYSDGISQNKTTANLTIGGTAQTGFITLGRSTATQTLYIGNGAVAAGSTKTISIGENGVANSITNISIGTAAGNGNVTFSANTLVRIANTSGTALSVAGNVTGGNVIATSTVYGNAATAFVAGSAAISGVALQMPQEGALRNLNNGLTNMYFDVSIGGSTNGQFQFRSSSSFTNVLTMSPTAFNVNTEAVVTARTASFGRLPWNSAIDTELTIDDYRWRITNSGGIYPQVISNTGGSKNSAWTAVAAISGSAITQGGSTGILLPNNSWTTLYTFGSMASAGDTVTVTFQDKNLGRIYRITFMRSDDGATTGYNIIAERLL